VDPVPDAVTGDAPPPSPNAPSLDDILAAAELWVCAPDHPARFVAGWEDAYPFCRAVCATDLGRSLCASCPEAVVERAARVCRVQHARCPMGVTLLGLPLHVPGHVAVLRVAPPNAASAARQAGRARVPPETLATAAGARGAADGRTLRAALGVLCRETGRLDWQARLRDRAADDRRAAAAATAQMLATLEDLEGTLRVSERQLAEIERNRRRLDRLARETLRAQDEERARVAHEIHDTAAQSMVSAFRFLDAARAAARRDGLAGTLASDLDAAADRLQTAIREVRAVLARILPPALEELGLGPAISARLEGVRREGVGGSVSGDLPRLQPVVEQALYGMTTEAMSNAIRHGRARNVDVSLRANRGRAVIVVADDGGGFDPRRLKRRGDGHGLGLPGMARQADWLGGRLRVSSRPGIGTRVRISIPLGRHRRDGPNAGQAR